MNIERQIELIEQWAKDRELDKKGTVEGQTIKTVEEMSELIKGICKNNIDMIKDAIGDVFVTLVVGNMIQNKENSIAEINKTIAEWDSYMKDNYLYSKEECINWAGEEEILWILAFTEEISDFISKNAEERYTSNGMYNIYVMLYTCALRNNLTLEDCIESAYNEIKNRKGKMINGTFVKESDLNA